MESIPNLSDLARRPGRSASGAPTTSDPDATTRRPDDDEPLGGDPPCWAHLFDDDPDERG